MGVYGAAEKGVITAAHIPVLPIYVIAPPPPARVLPFTKRFLVIKSSLTVY